MVKPRGWCLGLGLSDPWVGLWIVVKPKRLGYKKNPHGVHVEIQWHPCLFWRNDLVEIMAKPVIKVP